MAESWRTDKRKTAERGYGYRWQKARKRYLSLHPLCVMCQAEGIVGAANTVDHRIPHKGDQTLFWDENNWQSLCRVHHSGDKQAVEKSGKAPVRFGPDGWPVGG